MKTLKLLFIALVLGFAVNAFAGPGIVPIEIMVRNTDTFLDDPGEQLNAYYDLRNRKTYIQITHAAAEMPVDVTIHVQIFQHDRGCDELNFNDVLTLNDTVVYDLDNIIRNDGTTAPISLLDDSYGYVVVTAIIPGNPDVRDYPRALIGNFRIIDDAGYEYRTNMQNTGNYEPVIPDGISSHYILNFNNVDGANQADIVGFAYRDIEPNGTVINMDEGINFDVFVYDLNEEPLSCDNKNFACGNVMNYGVNDDYGASRGNDVLCEGGGLADPRGGYISLENATHNVPLGGDPYSVYLNFDVFVGYVGINNGNGTGSMDSWILNPVGIPTG